MPRDGIRTGLGGRRGYEYGSGGTKTQEDTGPWQDEEGDKRGATGGAEKR